MHRTRTTALVLAGVAATALSGCVAVRPSAPAPATRPVSSVTPTAVAEPQIVQGPAREVLDEVFPVRSEKPAPRSRPAGTPAPPEPARRTQRQWRPREHERPIERERPVERGSGVKRAVPRALPHTAPRAAAPPAPVNGSDVCGLGKTYGHWPADSPQARICSGTYGN